MNEKKEWLTNSNPKNHYLHYWVGKKDGLLHCHCGATKPR